MSPRTSLFALAAGACLMAPGTALASSVTVPSVRFEGAAANDRAGASVASRGDFNGDGHQDLVIGAPGALPNGGGGSGGVAYVVFGPFTPGTTIDLAALGSRGITLRGSAARRGQAAGTSVAFAGDFNGDGFDDVIVGAPAATPGQEGPQTRPGAAYVVFGSRTPRDRTLTSLGSHGVTLQGQSHHFPDAFGWTVAPLRDIDHDGNADIAITAPGNAGFEDEFTWGRAYVVFGRRAPGTIKMAAPGRFAFSLGPTVPGQPSSVSTVGDWNHDGQSDFALADGYALHGRGAVFVVYAKRRTAPIDLNHLGRNGVTIAGGTLHYRLAGASLAGGADIDGDRRSDVVIGEPAAYSSSRTPPAGAAWIVRGARSTATVDLRRPGTRAWEVARGEPGWTAGASVALGQFGGESHADLVMIANGVPTVVYGGNNRQTVRLGSMPASRGYMLDGSLQPPVGPMQMLAGSGGFSTVAATRDLDADGHDELLAGAPFAGGAGRTFAGSASLLFTP